MKVLVLLSCALACASAGLYGSSHFSLYDNFNTHDFGHNAVHETTYTVHHPQDYVKHKSDYAQESYGYYGGHDQAHVSHDGHPQDTPEVQHAKALHFQAHEEAKRAHHLGHSFTVTPVETHEVQLAKAAHFKAVEEAKHNRNHYTITPEETPEVQHARALHLAAHAKAKSGAHSIAHSYLPSSHYRRRRGLIGDDFGEDQFSSHGQDFGFDSFSHGGSDFGALDHGFESSGHDFGSHGGYTLIHDGKHPVDTPEVQKAKALHLAEHSKAHHF